MAGESARRATAADTRRTRTAGPGRGTGVHALLVSGHRRPGREGRGRAPAGTIRTAGSHDTAGHRAAQMGARSRLTPARLPSGCTGTVDRMVAGYGEPSGQA